MAEILVNVEVTEADILTGQGKDCYSCPVAHAFDRKLKQGYIASVGYLTGRIHDKEQDSNFDSVHKFPIPMLVTDFIKSFDNGGPVETFSFSIFLPEEFVKSDQ